MCELLPRSDLALHERKMQGKIRPREELTYDELPTATHMMKSSLF